MHFTSPGGGRRRWPVKCCAVRLDCLRALFTEEEDSFGSKGGGGIILRYVCMHLVRSSSGGGRSVVFVTCA